MNRRLIGLVVALVLAAVATIVLFNYVRTADERAREAEELAEVYRVQEDVAAGTSADDAIAQGLFERDEVPARAVPSGAVAQLGQIEGLIVTSDLAQGEIIVTQRFGDTVERVGDRLDVPDGMQAVSVQVSVVPGVAGFVEPQDTVSILATFEDPHTEYLLQNVEVLAVGQRVVTTEGGETGSSIRRSDDAYIFTLAVEAEAVEQLVFANSQGAVTFTLLPDGEQPEIDTPGRAPDNIFD